MLQNMGDSGGIWRVRLEANREDIIAVVSCNVQIVGASLVVLELQGSEFQLGYKFCALQRESMDSISRLGIVGEVSHRSVCSC